MFIDTHCHYDMAQFNDGRFELLFHLKKDIGIGHIIIPAVLAESNGTMRKKLDVTRYPGLLEGTGVSPTDLPNIWYAAGVHPTRIWGKHSVSESQWEAWIRESAEQTDTVAIGETGLDYHHPMDEQMLAVQHKWFKKQLEFSEEYSLPLVLHIRQASEDALKILPRYPLRQGGVVHCFCEGWETAKKIPEPWAYVRDRRGSYPPGNGRAA